MSTEREARYAEAIHRVWCTPSCVAPVRHASKLTTEARAVMAVADAEQAELRAEVTQLREAQRIGMELDNHHNAAMCPYCKPSRNIEAEAAEAELAALRGRIEALADSLADPTAEVDSDFEDDPVGCIVDELRALAAVANTIGV